MHLCTAEPLCVLRRHTQAGPKQLQAGRAPVCRHLYASLPPTRRVTPSPPAEPHFYHVVLPQCREQKQPQKQKPARWHGGERAPPGIARPSTAPAQRQATSAPQRYGQPTRANVVRKSALACYNVMACSIRLCHAVGAAIETSGSQRHPLPRCAHAHSGMGHGTPNTMAVGLSCCAVACLKGLSAGANIHAVARDE